MTNTGSSNVQCDGIDVLMSDSAEHPHLNLITGALLLPVHADRAEWPHPALLARYSHRAQETTVGTGEERGFDGTRLRH